MTTATTVVAQQQDSSISVEWGLPIWLEPLAVVERATIRLTPVFWGIGVPRGDGMPVVVSPGFLGDDGYLGTLMTFLKRIGYQPFTSEIGRNADCLQRLYEKYSKRVVAVFEETGREVVLLSHSLSGSLADQFALEHPDIVAGKISMASPKREIKASIFALAAHGIVQASIRWRRSGKDMQCYGEKCRCPTVRSMLSSESSRVPSATLYTKTDGVVNWRTCLEENGGINIEVLSTHVGMPFNANAYRVIAELLYVLTVRGSWAIA